MSEEKKESKQEKSLKGLAKTGKALDNIGFLMIMFSPIVIIMSIGSSRSLFTGLIIAVSFALSAIVTMGFGKMLIAISAIEINTRMMLLINKSD